MKQDFLVSGNGAAELERDIETWRAEGCIDEAFILDRVVHAARADDRLIVPILIPDDFLTEAEIERLEKGESLEQGLPDNLRISALENNKGETWLAAFTSEEQLNKREHGDIMNMPLKNIIEFAFMQEDCAGLVINPWDKQLSIKKPVLGEILNSIAEPTLDEVELQKGSDAYQNGDYEQALAHYRCAAEMGNVTAMSNLGYCYYYGRSVPVDKAKARECWKKAAILGDICATYKMGDMYRNGDLPADPVFAREFYWRAYFMAAEEKNIWCYPDACLRILKYCREEIADEIFKNLADEAVEGIRLRIEQGDTLSDKLYREALALQKSASSELT